MNCDLLNLQAVRERIPDAYSETSAKKNVAHLDWFATFARRPLLDIPAIPFEIERLADASARRRGKMEKSEGERVQRVIAIVRRVQKAGGSSGEGRPHDSYTRIHDYFACLAGRLPDVQDPPPPSTAEHRANTLVSRLGHVPLPQLDTEAVTASYLELTTKERDKLRHAIRWLNSLIEDRAKHPEIADLLPAAQIGAMPLLRPRPINWSVLPTGLQQHVEESVSRVVQPALSSWIPRKARHEYGNDPYTERRKERAAGMPTKKRSNDPAAIECSRKSLRGAVNWLLHYSKTAKGAAMSATSLNSVLTEATVDEAIGTYLALASEMPTYRDPTNSNTIKTRLDNLVMLARRGMREDWLAVEIDDLRAEFLHEHDYRLAMSRQREAFVRAMKRDPDISRRIVLGPKKLLAEARRAVASWDGLSIRKRQSICHLAMCGAMLALQLARPIQPRNLRHLTAFGADAQLEVPLAPGSDPWVLITCTKNKKILEHKVPRWVWPVVAFWIETVRPVYFDLTAVDRDSAFAYLFPGQKGAICVQTLANVWASGMEILGVPDLTPHMMRHVAGTIYLALRPGEYEVVAALLRDDLETVKRFYTTDDGHAAVDAFARALEEAYPEIAEMARAA